jgi:hypothetical protein
MATVNFTTLLGLAQPTTGDLSGTWGTEVNNYVSNYLDAAVAGTQTITTNTTLTKTTGAALSSTSSQYMVLLCSPASANITITAPAASKIYVIINTSATYTVKIVGAGPTTGVTIAVSEKALVAWNGSDFVRVGAAGVGGSTTQVQYNNAGSLGGISGFTTDGTRVTASTTIGVGGATPSTSGAGVTFPATQSASTDANTLDDYEEGTWTPTGNGVTLSAASGSYTKIGRMVYASFTATWPTTANTGNARIQGLPFSTTVNAGFALQYSDYSTNYFGTLASSGSPLFDFYSAAGSLLTNANFSTKNVRGIYIYEV